MVEQDLVLSRALAEIFTEPALTDQLAFRGGTALHKLMFESPGRYSEDIDLVQMRSGPIKDTLRAIQARLDPWLGPPSTRQTANSVKLLYRFESEATGDPLRLKVEINTREHFSVFGVRPRDLRIDSAWYRQETNVPTFSLEELLGTKLRALYQRKKGRDLFDLDRALTLLDPDPAAVVQCFLDYTNRGGTPVSRAQFEQNLHTKGSDPTFLRDTSPLLAPDLLWDADQALHEVSNRLVRHLPGKPWRGSTGGEPSAPQ